MMSEEYTRNVFEISKQKLEAESSIGVLAMLISGFAISLIPSIEENTTCRCSILSWDTSILQEVTLWLNTMFMVFVAGISGISVMYSTALYWKGMKIISTREIDRTVLIVHDMQSDDIVNTFSDTKGYLKTEYNKVYFATKDDAKREYFKTNQSVTFEDTEWSMDKRKELLMHFNIWWDNLHVPRKYIRQLFLTNIPLFMIGISFSPTIWCNDCVLGLMSSILFTLFGSIIYIIYVRIM